MTTLNKAISTGDIIKFNNGKKQYFVIETTEDNQWFKTDPRGQWYHNSRALVVRTASSVYEELKRIDTDKKELVATD